jgi:phosphoenolpyruvate---glycerone phosphotransferase subunit DhaL
VRKRCGRVAARAPGPLPRGVEPAYTRPTVTSRAPVRTHVGQPTEAAGILVGPSAIRAALGRCRSVVERHAAYLTRLDTVLGDGDHGDNLVIGFRAVDDLLADLPDDTPPGDLLRAVGHRLVAAVGGASGPLYGTAFLEAGAWAGDQRELDGSALSAMFRAATDGLARRGRCAPGDKTILDTLAPAANALERSVAAGASFGVAYADALRAGVRGMRSTRPLVARRGLALRLGERAVGHLDPGAVSCLLLLRALGDA